MQPGACSATASANRRPGMLEPAPGKVVTNGGCSVPQCTGTANRAPLSCDSPGRGLGCQVSRREPRSPPPDRHQGDVDGAARHGGDRGHLRIQPRVTGDPDDARWAPNQLAVGVVGPVRHGAADDARPAPGESRLRGPPGSSRPPGELRASAFGDVTRQRSPEHSSATAPRNMRRERSSAWSWCRWETRTTSGRLHDAGSGRGARRRSSPAWGRSSGSVRIRTPSRSRTTEE